MGIFGRNIKEKYGTRAAAELLTRPSGHSAMAISSPWAPASEFEKFAVDEALRSALGEGVPRPLTRAAALRIPGIKRAHGIVCHEFASIPKFVMDNDVRAKDQAPWLTNTASGVSPYHRDFGAASDWFFEGWACYGFTQDFDDCLHIPFGMWKVDADGYVVVDGTDATGRQIVPERYTANPIAIPLGYGENGVLNDGADTIRQAQKIEDAYKNRLDNPIALTVLTLDTNTYWGYTKEERAKIREEWNEGRKRNSTALKPADMGVDFPGAGMPTDLYESGRNGVRIDIANHTSLPASLLEGVRQGGSGGGTEIKYQGVQNGASRSELWDYGLPSRMLSAFEGRLSLDDVCASGLSIRGDLSNKFAAPNPDTNPTSED